MPGWWERGRRVIGPVGGQQVSRVFGSVEAMVEPAAVSDLIGRRVESVQRLPLRTAGFSSTGHGSRVSSSTVRPSRASS